LLLDATDALQICYTYGMILAMGYAPSVTISCCGLRGRSVDISKISYTVLALLIGAACVGLGLTGGFTYSSSTINIAELWARIVLILFGAIVVGSSLIFEFYRRAHEQDDTQPKPASGTRPLPGKGEAPLRIPDNNDLNKASSEVSTLYSPRVNTNELAKRLETGELVLHVREYPSFNHDVALVKGRYRIRLFFEFDDDVPGVANTPHRAQFSRENIAAVHYLLHETFVEGRIITSTSRKKGFESRSTLSSRSLR